MTKKKGKPLEQKRTGIIFFPEDAKEILRIAYGHYPNLRDRDEMLRLLAKGKKEELEVKEDGQVKKINTSLEIHELPEAIIVVGDKEVFSVQKKEVVDKSGKRKVKHMQSVSFEPIKKNTWARNIKPVSESLLIKIEIEKNS
jgi:hypothetical protein